MHRSEIRDMIRCRLCEAMHNTRKDCPCLCSSCGGEKDAEGWCANHCVADVEISDMKTKQADPGKPYELVTVDRDFPWMVVSVDALYATAHEAFDAMTSHNYQRVFDRRTGKMVAEREKSMRMTFDQLWDRAMKGSNFLISFGPFSKSALRTIASALFSRTSTKLVPQDAFDQAIGEADVTLTKWCNKQGISTTE